MIGMIEARNARGYMVARKNRNQKQHQLEKTIFMASRELKYLNAMSLLEEVIYIASIHEKNSVTEVMDAQEYTDFLTWSDDGYSLLDRLVLELRKLGYETTVFETTDDGLIFLMLNISWE